MASSGPSHDPGERDAILIRRRFDWGETPPSVALVLTMAALSQSAFTTTGGRSLVDYVDPDGLDALVTRARGDSPTVTVTIEDLSVRIRGNELTVRQPTTEAA